MRLLVFEFITGGGLLGAPLPDSLRLEGEMMRDALLSDLVRCADIEVTVMRDPRCMIFDGHPSADWQVPQRGESSNEFYRRILDKVDCVWPIAPETNGALAQLAAIARTAGKQVLLSDAATLKICQSKIQTFRALRAGGIDAIETFRASDPIQHNDQTWIVKPDDGAGAQGIGLYANSHAALQAALAANEQAYVLQPWCDGEALSISLLCARGAAQLLSVNRQRVTIEANTVGVAALQVNALQDGAGTFAALGKKIAAALPGLAGYVGVDLIRTRDGKLRVLEINPRLTTSYCALRAALGINVAKLARQIFFEQRLPEIARDKNIAVELNLAAAHV